jgi:hypothetical protein
LTARKTKAGSAGCLLPEGNGPAQWENPFENTKSAGPKPQNSDLANGPAQWENPFENTKSAGPKPQNSDLANTGKEKNTNRTSRMQKQFFPLKFK